jgi:hypothetical protein
VKAIPGQRLLLVEHGSVAGLAFGDNNYRFMIADHIAATPT